jgi:2-polyprenyl-6-methoxyphenol hydroxylase-like FAD-dependent oxidoreductase
MTDPAVRVDVIVVGAGPSGLVAAIRLLQLGLTVRIVDAASEAAQESRAALMHAATIEILAELGLGAKLVDHGVRVAAVTLADRGRVVARIPFAELDSPYPFALGIPQNVTEALLIARLEGLGHHVTRGVRIGTVTQDDLGCRVSGTHLRSSTRWTALSTYVVGADGKNSVVRGQAGIAFDGAPYEDDFVLADVRLAPAPAATDEARITFSPDGVTVLGMLPSGRYRVVATAPRGQDAPREPNRAYLDELLRSRGIRTATVDAPAWSSRFQISHHIARRFRTGNILLCGDAAHVHSPAAGQGMNTGIADAYELARSVAIAAEGDVAALDGYERLRLRAAREVVSLTDRITRIALLRSGPARVLRDTAIPLLTRVPRIRRALLRSVSGLDRSPLHARRDAG